MTANEFDREYLGDGLYAHRDRWGNVVLTTQRDVEHFVVLDPAVLAAFVAWLERGEKR